jgi:hypothetical protein
MELWWLYSLFLSDVRIGSAQQPIGSLYPSRLQLFYTATTILFSRRKHCI